MGKHILKTPYTDIVFEPQYKVSLWTGMGSDGKTALCNYLIHNSRVCPDYEYMGDTVKPIDENKILVYDEDDISDDSVINYIKTCNNCVIILSRGIITSIKLNYKAIYNLVANSNGKMTLQRRYKNYTEFHRSTNYLIEDSGTAFQYARYWLNNVETTNGNTGIVKKVTTQLIIADGCGIVKVLDFILKKTDSLFLYDSFESALLHEMQITIDPLKVFDVESESTVTLCKLYKRYSKGGILHEELFAKNIFHIDKPTGPDIINIIGALVLFISYNKDLKNQAIESDKYSFPERQLLYIVKNTNRATPRIINLYNQYYNQQSKDYKKLVCEYCEKNGILRGVSEKQYRDKMKRNSTNYEEFYNWLLEGNGYK